MDYESLQSALEIYNQANDDYQNSVRKDTQAYIAYTKKCMELWTRRGEDVLSGNISAAKFDLQKNEESRKEKMNMKVWENGVKVTKAKMEKAWESLQVTKILIKK